MMAVDESKMTCDDLAKKCKAGDKKACEIYKEKCGKVRKNRFIHISYLASSMVSNSKVYN